MQRIEAIVQNEVAIPVVKAIREKGADAVTFMESLGQWKGERPEFGGKIADFNTKK